MKLDIDIEKQIARYNYENSVLARKRPTKRFVLGSILLHFLSASAVMVLQQPAEQTAEVVEIAYADIPVAKVESAPQEAPVTQEAAPAAIVKESSATPAPVQAEVTPEPAPAVVQKAEPKAAPVAASKTKASEQPVAQKSEAPAVVAAAAMKSEPAPVAESAPQETQAADATPETLDDIETPTLDDSEVVAAIREEPKSKVSKEDIEKKLQEAEKAQAEKSALLAQQMEQETKNTESALGNQLNEAESAVAEENAALAAQAQERTEALKSAQAAQAAEGTQTSAENGSGENTQSAGPGQAGPLRTLDQLRQMPGNPKPQYTPNERLQGQQGAVIFKAFVTKEGQLTNFEMLQSTGHRNLDFKTLKALKQWKFYPGQQGWVELPFKWDLKGGPQEMPTLLRRRVSQQN